MAGIINMFGRVFGAIGQGADAVASASDAATKAAQQWAVSLSTPSLNAAEVLAERAKQEAKIAAKFGYIGQDPDVAAEICKHAMGIVRLHKAEISATIEAGGSLPLAEAEKWAEMEAAAWKCLRSAVKAANAAVPVASAPALPAASAAVAAEGDEDQYNV